MLLSEIIGQDRAVEILRRELKHDRVPHAYLFSGPEGIGKRTTARALAMTVECEEVAGDACGECPSCRKIRLDQHPDVRTYAPLARTKGATEKIYIDQIRDLQGDIALRTMEGRMKVMILEGADRMVDQAANALLKTLEEPPGDALLILTAAFPDLLPSTIRSRCRMIRFQLLSEGAVAQILMRERGIGQEQAARLARYSQGSLSGVMEAELEDLVSRRDRFLEGMQAWEESDIVSVLEFAGRFTGSTGEAMDFVELLLEWTRDLIAIKLKGPAGVLMYQDRIEQLLEKSRCMSLSDLLARFDDLRATHQRLGRNVNARLALEVALGRMAK